MLNNLTVQGKKVSYGLGKGPKAHSFIRINKWTYKVCTPLIKFGVKGKERELYIGKNIR